MEKSGLIFKHPQSLDLYPVYLLHRDLMREDYNIELRQIFGGEFDNLGEVSQQTLSLIYQVNTYSKNRSVSATQAGRLLFLKANQSAHDIKAFDAFKRKIYIIFKQLVVAKFLIADDKTYFINQNFERSPSLFDKLNKLNSHQ